MGPLPRSAAAALHDALTVHFGGGFDAYQQALATELAASAELGFPTPLVNELLVFAVNRTAAEIARAQATAAPSGPSVLFATEGAAAAGMAEDRPICIEMHDQYATDRTTYVSGSRTRDGRWVPYVGGEWVEPSRLDMALYWASAYTFGQLTGVYFWDSVVKEWVDHFVAGTGTSWHGTYDHPVSAKAAQMLESLPGLRDEIDGKLLNAIEAYVIANEPPEGITTARIETTIVDELHFAKYTLPEMGNALWNLGQTTLALGRSPTGGNTGFDVRLVRAPDEFIVDYTVTDLRARIEDIFQIWEEKVNYACKLNATGRPCPGYKRDIGLLFEWAYMLDLFGPARCFDWYINLVLPKFSGRILMAGVRANAGGDMTVMLGEGEEEVLVTLNGSAKVVNASLMGAGDPKPAFVWRGLIDLPDVQSPTVRLRAGSHVFLLEANAVGRAKYLGRTFSDLNSVTVTVVPYEPEDEKKPQPVQSWDPNDKIAPAGLGGTNVVPPDSTLPYTVRFENDPQQATAPAQIVRIVDRLHGDLDWSSFEFGAFGFGPVVVDLPPGLKVFETEVDLTPFGTELYVAVQGSLNPANGEVTIT